MPRFSGALIGLAVALGVMTARPALAGVFDPQTYTLDNGLRVVLIENRRAPVVHHIVWYKVGAADEPPGVSGIAHFLEHLMFKGTDALAPGAFSKTVAINGGRDNAFTGWDFTAYHQTIARDRLDVVMRMEADRMINLRLSDADVLAERDVILEERNARTDTDPAALLGEQMRRALFMHHPYGRPIIGWRHEMETLGREDALRFYRKWYAPDNAIVIVAGDMTLEELKPLVEEHYAPIPRGPGVRRKRVGEPTHHAARRIDMVHPRAGRPSWRRTYLAPSVNGAAPEVTDALSVLTDLLGGGTTSHLYRRLVVERGLASQAGAWYDATALDLATLGLYAVPRPEVSLEELERAVEEELAVFLATPPTQEQVDRVARRLIDGAVFARDRLRAGAHAIGRMLAVGGTIGMVETWPARIGALTAGQVDAVRGLIDETRSVTATLRPPVGEER